MLVGDNGEVVISSPFVIILSAAEKAVLAARVLSGRAEHRMVIRAKIVLAAAQGHTNASIAAETEMHIDTVRKWRKRFSQHRLDGLKDRHRSGRPPVFSPVEVAVAEGVVSTISASTVGRWLAADAIMPWQHRSWIFPRDPTSPPKRLGCSTSTTAVGKAPSSVRTGT